LRAFYSRFQKSVTVKANSYNSAPLKISAEATKSFFRLINDSNGVASGF
jgi:hypothetical protein